VVILARTRSEMLETRWPLAFLAVLAVNAGTLELHLRTRAELVGKGSDHRDILDARAEYPGTTLLAANRTQGYPAILPGYGGIHSRHVDIVREQGAIGYHSFYAGPQVHIIDSCCALVDPLFAHMPPYRRYEVGMGHLHRVIPQGYMETLRSGENRMTDPDLALYYDKLSLITRGDLFDPERLVAIWKMNTGQYDHLIDRERYRYPGMLRVTLEQVDDVLINEPDEQNRLLMSEDAGAEIDLGHISHATRTELALGRGNDYDIVYRRDGREIHRQKVYAMPFVPEEIALYLVDVPARIASQGYDHIRIFPRLGSGPPYLEHIRLLDDDDMLTTNVMLGSEWEFRNMQTPDLRWTPSPATITIESPRQQAALLWIKPAHLYDPASPAVPPAGDSGTLDIHAGSVLLASVPVTVQERVAVPLLLQPGRQQFRLSLQAGNFTEGDKKRSFALSSLRIEPQENELYGTDLYVNSLQQQPGRQEVSAIYGSGWYDAEPEAALRWAQSPAHLLIHSPVTQWAELVLLPAALHDPAGTGQMGYQGTLQVTTNGELPQEVTAVVGQPLTVGVPLIGGLNRVTLTWEAGSFRPVEIDPTTQDERALSFAVNWIDLRIEE
jgi:hypothetical protein